MYIDHPASFTDYYELTMAQGYLFVGDASKKCRF